MNPTSLPFAHLNLCRNPFGELEPEARAALAVVEVEQIAGLLRSPPVLLQILGRRGRGKTTHLHALRAAFPGAPYVHVLEGETCSLPDAPALFVDNAEHLPVRTRKRLFHRARSLAITTHVDLTPEIETAGTPYQTLEVGGCGEERLLRIIRARIENARRGRGALPRVGGEAARALLALHGDDLRAIEHDLYERFQAMKEIGDVQV